MNKEREEKTVTTVYGISKLSNKATTWVPEGRRDAIQTWYRAQAGEVWIPVPKQVLIELS